MNDEAATLRNNSTRTEHMSQSSKIAKTYTLFGFLWPSLLLAALLSAKRASKETQEEPFQQK